MKFGGNETITVMAREMLIFFFSLSQKDQISHQSEADERKIEEKKLGSKVYALNKSPSSVHLELDASLIIAILTHTKDRIALNYICWTVHSR